MKKTRWILRRLGRLEGLSTRMLIGVFAITILLNGLATVGISQGNSCQICEDVESDIPYTITFSEVKYDYPTDGKSTWYYEVSRDSGAKDVSHWNLELCSTHQVVDTAPGGITTEVGTDGSINGCSPYSNMKWIKWDDLDDGYIPFSGTRTFSVTLDGNWQKGTVSAAIKAGTGCYFPEVIGPLCEERKVVATLGPVQISQSDLATVFDGGSTKMTVEGGDLYANFNPDLDVSLDTDCTNFEVKTYYTVSVNYQSSPQPPSNVTSSFEHPALEVKSGGSYKYIKYDPNATKPYSQSEWNSFTSLNGIQGDGSGSSFPVRVNLSKLGDLTAGWKFDFTIQAVMQCND